MVVHGKHGKHGKHRWLSTESTENTEDAEEKNGGLDALADGKPALDVIKR